MEKTIKMMKESGLFDSLVENILKKDMPKEAVEYAIDEICTIDENFENCFFTDIHSIGLNVIWEGLCIEAEKRKVEDLKKEEMMNVVIVKQGCGRYLFACPEDVNLKEGEKVLCDTKKGETDGVCFTDSFKVNQKALGIIAKLLCATFPLKSVIGRCEVKRF